MSSIFDLFNKHRPLPKSERYYEDEPESRISKYLRFPVFVCVALVLVVAIVISMFAFNRDNTAFALLNRAIVNNFDCGSFKYDICSGVNGVIHMKYDGAIEFDLQQQKLETVYHATYDTYEYDAVVYGEGINAYRGNFYDGKWSVDDYSEKALDFYDFYRDYRKGDFDAGAVVRFTDTNDTFNPQQLLEAVENISKELSKPSNMKEVVHYDVKTEDDVTTVTIKPQLEKVFYIVTDNIGSAFSSANEYAKFKADVMNSTANLSNAELEIIYVINENEYLSDLSLRYSIGDKTYFIQAKFSEFMETEVLIPEDFLKAANL